MSDGRILNGKGTAHYAEVDSSNRLHTKAVTLSENIYEAEQGNAYNLNTGKLALTDGSVESALIYFKNTDTKRYILNAVAVGMNDRAGTVSDGGEVIMTRNPTTGTMIDNEDVLGAAGNRSFGSSALYTSRCDCYAGGQGYTFTDGTDEALFFNGSGPRLFATIDFVVPQDASFGLKILPNCTGAVNVYAALIGFWEEIE